MNEVITQQQVLEWTRMPDGWLRLPALAVLVLLAAVVVWMYRREARVGASAALRGTLAVLRCAVLVGLAAIWLDPVLATYTQQTLRAWVPVLIDTSASMSIRDVAASGEPQPARIERVAELLSRADGEWLRRLAKRNELMLLTFGEQTGQLDDPAGAALPPESLAAKQNATDIGEALTRAVELAGGRPIASVVLITDGGINRGLDFDECLAYVQRQRLPVHVAGVGDPDEPPNLRIADVAAPAVAPLGDPLEVRVQVTASGMDPQTARLELALRRPGTDDAEDRIVLSQDVSVGGEVAALDVPVRIDIDAAGELVLRARITSAQPEAVLDDNQRETSVQVVDERLRVLIVAGRPSFDYRFVSRLFERDRTIDVSCWLQSADERAVRDGDTVIVELPRRPEELFAYDAILLIDPDPRELDSSWAIAVRRLVDDLGGGLLFQAGPHYTTRLLSDPRLEELIALLPVTPHPDAAVRLTAQGAFRLSESPVEIPAESRSHPLLALSDDPEVNSAIWRALPGAWWRVPVLRAKPLATVLLRQAGAGGSPDDPGILLAAQPFGSGRVVFVGYDGTWRWRPTGEPQFNRFWVQMVRYLAQGRRQTTGRYGVVNVDRATATTGDVIEIEARVLDRGFAPWLEPAIAGEVQLPDGQVEAIELHAAPGREGWFTARIVVRQAGATYVRVPLPDAPAAEPLGRRIIVRPPDQEMRSLAQRSADLQRLAEASGGRYVSLEQADQLPDLIDDATVQRPPIPGPRQALWDRPWVLALLAALLGIEWTLRRRNHLL